MVRNYESTNQVSKSDAKEGSRVFKKILFLFSISHWGFLLLNEKWDGLHFGYFAITLEDRDLA